MVRFKVETVVMKVKIVKCNIVVIRNKVAVVRFRVCLHKTMYKKWESFSFALFFKYSHIDELKMHLHYASQTNSW